MPDKGESVVEDVGRVGPRVAGIKHIGSIGFCQLHLHKLGKFYLFRLGCWSGFRAQTCFELNWILIKTLIDEWGRKKV